MLPTRPRALARSMCNSCTTPCSSIATRVSCGVTLMRISWAIGREGWGSSESSSGSPRGAAAVQSCRWRLEGRGRSSPRVSDTCLARVRHRRGGSWYGKTRPREQSGGFGERQSHDARIAAVEAGDERRGAPLDAVAAGLVERLAGCDVGARSRLATAARASPSRSTARNACRPASAAPRRSRRRACVRRAARASPSPCARRRACRTPRRRARPRCRRRAPDAPRARARAPLPADVRLGARDALDVVQRPARRRARPRARPATRPGAFAQPQHVERDADLRAAAPAGAGSSMRARCAEFGRPMSWDACAGPSQARIAVGGRRTTCASGGHHSR